MCYGPPLVIITSERLQLDETEPAVSVFRIRRSHANGSLTVGYEVDPSSTAQSGIDYVALSGSVTFADGEYYRDIEVDVTDDGLFEPTETLTVVLTAAPASQYTLGGRISATASILDDDIPIVSVFAIDDVASENSDEAGTNGTFRFARTNTNGPLTVTFGLDESSTATSGTDFMAFGAGAGPWTVVFADGQEYVDLDVHAILDGFEELPETIVIVLDPTFTGAPEWLPGDVAVAVVTINDLPVFVSLELHNDTGTAGDGITSDPTVRATFVDDGFLSNAYSNSSTWMIETDLGADGTIDFTDFGNWEQLPNGDWIQAVEFDPLGEDAAAGPVTLKSRVVEILENGDRLEGWWQTLNILYQPEPVNQAPTFATTSIELSVNSTIASGGTVGTLTATDPDAGDTLTYSMQASPSIPLAIDSATGAVTYTGGGLGGRDQFEITVIAQDQDGLSASIDVLISILEINLAPQFAAGNYEFSVAADARTGRVVGVPLASDSDAGDALTFSLSDAGSPPFAIDSATGEVRYTGGAVTANTTYTLSVSATDAHGNVSTVPVTIDILTAGSTAGTGTEELSPPGGVGGIGFQASPTATFIPTTLGSGTTSSTSTAGFAKAISQGASNAVASGTQNLTKQTTTTGALGGNWSYVEIVSWSYDITQSSGSGNSTHLFGGYTYTLTASYNAGTDAYDTNFLMMTDDHYAITTTTTFASGSMTLTSSGLTTSMTTIHVVDGPGVGSPFGLLSYFEDSFGSSAGNGTYSYGIAGGAVNGTMTSDRTYADNMIYTESWIKDPFSGWELSLGFSSLGGNSHAKSSTVGSGNSITPITGGYLLWQHQRIDV